VRKGKRREQKTMREGEEIEGGRTSKREKGIIDNECGARDRKRKGERG
jgi:hypothetical protein